MKVLIYAPHSAIWVHAFPEALVAEALLQQGNDVVYVGCGRQFSRYCVAMSAFGLTYDSPEQEKENICRNCEKNESFLRSEFGLNGPDIAGELSAEDTRHLEQVLETATPENYLSLTYSGIDVGRLALYEFLLNHKKNNLEITPGEWPAYKAALWNSLCSALAGLKIIQREKPDAVITYNSFYSVNHVCCIAADNQSVPHYLLHAGANMAHRMETLTLSKGYAYNYITRNPVWDVYRAQPRSIEKFGVVTDHMLALFEATSVFVYSAPKSQEKMDLRQKFGISPQQKVLVATMSSHDERFAAVTIGVMPKDGTLVFPEQIDWIRALTVFVAGRDDLFLLIRVHPREFPNKRESVTSEYASKLQNLLVDLPANVKVNWPGDAISLYDLADIAGVFLNSRSTTGLEMSMLGLPVVIYSPDQLYSYPPDLNYTADTLEDYFLQIDRALAHGWDIEFARMAFRWGVFQYCHAVFDISESYGKELGRSPNLMRRAINKLTRSLIPLFEQRKDARCRAESLKDAKLIGDFLKSGKSSVVEMRPEVLSESSLDRETAALRYEFARIYAVLYPGKTQPMPGSLQEKMQAFINGD